jgi:hydrogenase/urease accessory protein HupE
LLACVSLVLLVGPCTVSAHPLAPALLEIEEVAPGELQVRWKISRFRAPGSALEVRLPSRCRELEAAVFRADRTSASEAWTVACGPEPLTGESFAVLGLGRARVDVLLRASFLDGRRAQALLRAGAAEWRVPERAEPRAVAAGYLRIGAEHIASGADHLLFLLGLVLLAGWTRALLWTVTAFTAGHSVTLALAVLGLVRVSSAAVEFLIALSVLVLAVELAQGAGRERLLRRRPALLAGVFGLLHGLGFAGALAEVGLPGEELPLALLAFNLGIEAGQLAFIALLLLAAAALRAVPLAIRERPALRHVPVYAMGTLASYWCLERAAAWLWPV